MSEQLDDLKLETLKREAHRLCSQGELLALINEAQQHRAMRARLAEWADQLRTAGGCEWDFAQELERRIADTSTEDRTYG